MKKLASTVAMSTALAVASLSAAAQDAPSSYVRWEGETPAATDARLQEARAENPAFSDGAVLRSKGGTFVEYEVEVSEAGNWYFFARNLTAPQPFRWRFDDQPWHYLLRFAFRGGRLPSAFLKTDTDWIEAEDRLANSLPIDQCREGNESWSWMALGRVELSAGKHLLRIEPDGKELPPFDAFLLSRTQFTPRGPLKPDDPLPQEDGWWAFAPEGDTDSGLALNLRELNEPVAGSRGFIETGDESFVYPDTGEPIRFWASHIMSAEAPPELIEHQARFLARRGVNLVRIYPFHWKAFGPEGLEVDPVKVRRAQRLVDIYKRQGIYVKLCLYSGRVFNDLPAVPGFEDFKRGDSPFMLHLFHPEFQPYYETWIRELLTAENPYGPPLAQEPAILGIELQNESNTLWYAFQARKYPTKVWAMVEKLYAKWLEAKYGSLDVAWKVWGEKPSADEPNLMLDTWKLIRGPSPRAADQVRFSAELERDFYERTKKLVKDEIGFGGLVLGSNWDTSNDALLFPALTWAEQPSDFIDHHHYFHTPGVGRPDKGKNRAEPGRANSRIALRWEGLKQGQEIVPCGFLDLIRDGKPGMCSEYSWRGASNPWRSEYPLFVAAQSRAGGMDCMVDFQSNHLPGWAGNEVRWINQTPAQAGQFPAAALLFRTNVLAEGKTLAHMRVNTEDALDLRVQLPVTKVTTGDTNRAFNQGEKRNDAPPLKAEQGVYFSAGKVRLDVGDFPSNSELADLSPYWDPATKMLRHSNGQIEWDYGTGLYTVDAPGANVAIGFLGAKSPIQLGGIRLETEMEFGAVALVSVDGKPLAESGRMLLQVMSSQKQRGLEIEPFESEGAFTVSGNPSSPYMVRNLSGRIQLLWPGADSVRVTPLNPNFTAADDPVSGPELVLRPDVLYYLIQADRPTQETDKTESDK